MLPQENGEVGHGEKDDDDNLQGGAWWIIIGE
jgi:hypothetical protein